MPVPAARPWGDVLTPAGLARLRGEGWPLPAPLPGALSLLGHSRVADDRALRIEPYRDALLGRNFRAADSVERG